MKQILGVSVVLAIAVGGLAFFLLFAGNTKEAAPLGGGVEVGSSTEPMDMTAQPITGVGSLESLLARAENLECSISYTPVGETAPVTGTYFTTSGMMRGDFVVPGLDPDTVSSLVVRDETLYTWSTIQGQTYGMKVSLAMPTSTVATHDSLEAHEPVPFDAPVRYDCTPWLLVDKSIFELPSDVLFRDFASVSGGGMEYGTVYEESALPATSPCDLCNQVSPGPGQDECKARFSCE